MKCQKLCEKVKDEGCNCGSEAVCGVNSGGKAESLAEEMIKALNGMDAALCERVIAALPEAHQDQMRVLAGLQHAKTSEEQEDAPVEVEAVAADENSDIPKEEKSNQVAG